MVNLLNYILGDPFQYNIVDEAREMVGAEG